ncbi:protease pro-enzyme activation domain-containing protein [Actinoplanes sp. NPDC049596]|uniref:protease pro-enzyme activation domain-containing protein n=1 Tax=unclassified Actinoplanes TaxID=2626549 RepID=UPI00342295DF
MDRQFAPLSAGQKTRVSPAGALLNRPAMPLLDEPAARLDPDTAHWVRGLLERYRPIPVVREGQDDDQYNVLLISDRLQRRVHAGMVVAACRKNCEMEPPGRTTQTREDGRLRVMHLSRHFRFGGTVAAAMLLGSLLSAPAHAVGARHSLPDPAVGWTKGQTPSGTADPAHILHLRVYLAGRDAAAKRTTALAVSDPSGPAYGRYLSPAEFMARFGPTEAQTRAVTSWLTGQGMTVTGTTSHYVAADGTVAQVDSAFATTIKEFGSSLSPVGGVSVPAELAGDIAAVTGLWGSEFAAKARIKAQTKARTGPRAASKSVAADYGCSQWWGQHYAPVPTAYGHTTAPTVMCGYTPQQLRAAYGVKPHAGRGTTVAIIAVGHLPSMEADANRFFADQHLPGFAPGQYTATAGAGCDNQSPMPVEEALDTETVHIIAPEAKVVFVGAACPGDNDDDSQTPLLDAETTVVDQHLADVSTDSYSFVESAFSEADRAAWDMILEQGTIEGIGFNFNSGDGGDDSTGEITFPASDPWATAVGSTSLRIGADNRILGETAWGDNLDEIDGAAYSEPLPGFFAGGSTGGRSSAFAQPAYQRAAVPEALATAGGTGPARRVIPDVSVNGGELWLIGFTGADQVFEDGGPGYDVIPEGATSGSSPLLAALEADAKEVAGHALGFVNPALYARAGTAAVHDVLPVDSADPPIEVGPQPGSPTPLYLNTLGKDSSLTATPGFDNATGLGSATRSFVDSFRR